VTHRVWTIEGRNVRAEIQDLGAMAGPAWFNVGGRIVQPFAVAPWFDDPPERLATLPPLLHRMRGEWPCVPFGMPAPRRDLAPDWMAGLGPDDIAIDDQPHGAASGSHWLPVAADDTSVHLVIDLPAPHPIARMNRTVAADPDRPALHMSLSVTPRADADLPIGLHPVFALPSDPGAARLVLRPSARAWTFPAMVEPGISRFAPDQRDADPTRIALTDGGTVDVTSLPLPFATEELVLLTGPDGAIDLVADGVRTELRWDAGVFPSCLLWLSNRGRTAYPWNGRHLAIGIEPVCAPFDLGVQHANNPKSPLLEAKNRIAHRFRAGMRLDTLYSVTLAVA
jgi:hypothetical protein